MVKCVEKTISDSIIKRFPEVTVTADKVSEDIYIRNLQKISLSSTEIKNYASKQLSDVLFILPGLSLTDYGGFNGSKSISVRGTNSRQSNITIDGFKMNSPVTGGYDFSSFPTSLLKSISMVKGGNSLNFANGVIGGMLMMYTDFGDDKTSGSIKAFYGSFNEKSFGLKVSYPTENVIISGMVDYTKSEGNYTFSLNEFGQNRIIARENADFQNVNGSFGGLFNFGKTNLKSRLILRDTERGVPGPVLQGKAEPSHGRLNEKEALFYLSGSNQLSENSVIYSGISAKVNDMEYSDPDFLGNLNGSLYNFYTLRELQFNFKLLNKSSDLFYNIGLETESSDLRSNSLKSDLNGAANHSHLGIPLFLGYDFAQISFVNLYLTGGSRLDLISRKEFVVSPAAGFLISLKDMPLSLKTNMAYNFREPSFSELYYFNYGKPDLKPERAVSLSGSIIYKIINSIEIEFSGFMNKIHNQIISIPVSPVTWVADNVEDVLTRGLEAGMAGNFFKNIVNFRLSYTLQKATDEGSSEISKGKEIPYIPKELISGSLNINYNNFILGGIFSYSSYRYSLADNSAKSVIPSYYFANVFVLKEIQLISFLITIRFDCYNITDSRYSVILNYPNPGRSFRAGVYLSYN